MKPTKIISWLTEFIILLSVVCTLTGLLSGAVHDYPDAVSAYGESIALYQVGLYARDSVSMASQALAQDFVTLTLGVPLLAISLFLIHKSSSVQGWFMLSGTLSYFLYTYVSYSVLIIYNHLYLIYIALTILAFYAFFLSLSFLRSFNTNELFSENYPVKPLCIFLILTGLTLGGMWLGRILPSVTGKEIPFGLEHYSTLVIQSLDLGFVVPAAFVAALLLYRKQSWGYLLSAVLVMKMLTMGMAVSAMAFNMMLHGVKISLLEKTVFPMLVLINVGFFCRMLKTLKKHAL